jgi:23S rRNA pseudouridine1911/1915/1917 synthase
MDSPSDVDSLGEKKGRPSEDDGVEHVSLSIRRTRQRRRLDSYLQTRFSRLSRTAIQGLIKGGGVKVNDRKTKSSYTPKEGDRVDLILPAPVPLEIAAEPIPLDILHEDDYILILNKQADLIIHPARGAQGGTLANGLVHYSESLSQTSDPFRPGIVHRLDKNTTGVIAVAKTDEAHWRLALQFEKREVEKEYVAVVHGEPELDGDVIDVPIMNHPRMREKCMASPWRNTPSGRHKHRRLEKSAVTRYQVERRFKGYSILRLFPKTGRTHQLRVHSSFIGHPCVGDSLYGGRQVSLADLSSEGPDAPLIDRQALHARRLRFRHPIHGERVEFTAPLPADMENLIEVLESFRSAS